MIISYASQSKASFRAVCTVQVGSRDKAETGYIHGICAFSSRPVADQTLDMRGFAHSCQNWMEDEAESAYFVSYSQNSSGWLDGTMEACFAQPRALDGTLKVTLVAKTNQRRDQNREQ